MLDLVIVAYKCNIANKKCSSVACRENVLVVYNLVLSKFSHQTLASIQFSTRILDTRGVKVQIF